MTEVSGPLVGEPFTDDQWRTALGRQGIVQDYTGTAYSITLPTSSNDVQVSPGKSVVAGFGHEVPVGEAHAVTIPESSNAAVGRTDVIAVRYDASYTEEPGPCRLVRVAGTEGSASLPVLDRTPPGVEVLPLWAITRRQGQALTETTPADMRMWVGPSVVLKPDAALPDSAPVGTRVRRGNLESVRRITAAGTPQWHTIDLTDTGWVSSAIGNSGFTGTRRYRRSRDAQVTFQASGSRSSASGTPPLSGADLLLVTLADPTMHPAVTAYGVAWVNGAAQRAYCTTTGEVHVHPMAITPGQTFQVQIAWPTD